MKYLVSRGQTNLSIFFILASGEEKGYYRVVWVGQLSFKQNQFDSKAGTTARAIETLMGQYFD